MSEVPAIPDRRARFRELVARLDGSGDPRRAVEDGLYVPRREGPAERIAASLEIHPTGTHLMVGTIGSGKTTELLRVMWLLAERAPELVVELVELGWDDDELAPHPPTTLVSGGAPIERTKAANPPRVWRTVPVLPYDVADTDITLVDGLDRTSAIETARTQMQKFVGNAAQSRVGLVCVGPPQLQAELPSVEADWFEHVHVCGAQDISTEEGRRFLTTVLRHRAGDAFSPDAVSRVVTASGGIMRDLILLARLAVEEAYVRGAEAVEPADADAAIGRMGLSLLRAVDTGLLAHLQQLDRAGSAGQTAELRVMSVPAATAGLTQLVLHRLLIPLPGVPARYLLHPCILPHLRDAA